jgi:hypothetical protein
VQKENSKGEQHNKVPRDPLGGRSSLSSPHQSSPTQLHCVQTWNTSNHKHRKTYGKTLRIPLQQHLPQQIIQRTGLPVQAHSSTNSDTLKIATVVQQIMTELSEALSEKDRIMIITIMVLNLMKQNGF